MDAVFFELFGRKQNIDLRRSEFLVGWGAAGKGELGGGGRVGVEKDFAYPLKEIEILKNMIVSLEIRKWIETSIYL